MGMFSGVNMAAYFQGQQLIADLDEKKTETAQRKQQTANLQMTNLMNKRALEDKQALSQFMQSQQAKDDAPAANAEHQAKSYQKAAEFAASRGDYDGMAKMEQLAKGETEVAFKEQGIAEKKKQDNLEELSTAAQDVAATPSPENHKKLYNLAIKSGVQPSEIPRPGTPEYSAFVNNTALSSMKGQKRLDFLEKVREHTTQENAIKAERERVHEERSDRAKELAADRADRSADRKEAARLRETLAASLIEAREKKAASVEAGGAIQHRQTVAAVNYANEVVRGLNLISDMSRGQTVGTFAHLDSPTTILKSLEKTGTNKLSPEMQQIYGTATKGLGLELAQLATAGSGRSPNKDVIRELGSMVEAIPGDKEYEVIFKVANAADFARTRLEAVPKSSDPNIQKIREKAETELARFPSPKQVIDQAERQGVRLGKLKKSSGTMRDTLDKMIKSTVPDNIQSLLDQYPASN